MPSVLSLWTSALPMNPAPPVMTNFFMTDPHRFFRPIPYRRPWKDMDDFFIDTLSIMAHVPFQGLI
jgi:hypothetical protein